MTAFERWTSPSGQIGNVAFPPVCDGPPTSAERLKPTQNGHPCRNRQRSRMTVTRVERIAVRRQ
jgi:hypothetical protein